VFLGAPNEPLYVSGAKVLLYGDAGISSTITDRDGKFSFLNVEPPGIYFLEATYSGFRAEQNVIVDAGAAVQASLRLEAPDGCQKGSAGWDLQRPFLTLVSESSCAPLKN
jgi:hypothetical protein